MASVAGADRRVPPPRFAVRHGFDPADYARLHAWSLAEPEAFYADLWDVTGVIGDKGAVAVARDVDPTRVRFFPEARLNYAENLLREPDERTAIIAHRDDGARRELTRRELHDLVSRCVQALRAEGIVAGDRVAAIVTNDIEAVALYLAVAAIGAIWASCSPDFGPGGARDRLTQIEPVLLVAVPRYGYAGKRIETTASVNAVADAPSTRRIVLLGAPPEGATMRGRPSRWRTGSPFAPRPIDYHRGPFDAPLRSSSVRYDRQAQVHRARRAGCCCSISGAPAALRPRARGPAVLLHDLRLDDVELAGERAGLRCGHRRL